MPFYQYWKERRFVSAITEPGAQQAMTIAFKAHFDGRVIVPEEAVDLPRDRQILYRAVPQWMVSV
jgi:hypothetical protein